MNRLLKIKRILFVLFISFVVPVCAQPITWSRASAVPVSVATGQLSWFQSQFAALIARWGVPGGTVAVMRNGQLLYAAGFGYADIASKQTVQASSLFRVASISKVVTAVAVLKLVQDGKIGLDDKVFTILNDLQVLPGMRENPEINKITVRDLLAMSSGWAHRPGGFDPMFGPWPDAMQSKLGSLPATCAFTTRYMMSQPLQFKPGTSYSYNNLNYCILGLIVSKVTSNSYTMQSYQNYVKANILAPIGITQMQIGHSTREGKLPNEVSYYDYGDVVPPSGLPYGNKNVIEANAADGGWVATSIDLAKFVQAVASGKIIDPKLIRQMTSRQIPNQYKSVKYQGLGWRVISKGHQLSWYKTGSFTGTNGLVVKRADGIVIAVVFNTMPSNLGRFRVQLMGLLFSKNLLKE